MFWRPNPVRLALLLIVASVAGAAVAAAGLAQTSGTPRSACHVKTLTFLFWPGGHPAIASIGFPSFPYPHMEVYKSGATYPNGNEVAVIGFGQNGQPFAGLARSCSVVAPKLTSSSPLKASAINATALVCTFPVAVQVETFGARSPVVTVGLRAILPSKRRVLGVEVSARMVDSPTGSVIKFDGKYCKAYPPPR